MVYIDTGCLVKLHQALLFVFLRGNNSSHYKLLVSRYLPSPAGVAQRTGGRPPYFSISQFLNFSIFRRFFTFKHPFSSAFC